MDRPIQPTRKETPQDIVVHPDHVFYKLYGKPATAEIKKDSDGYRFFTWWDFYQHPHPWYLEADLFVNQNPQQ